MHVTGGDTPRRTSARRTSISRWRNPRLLMGAVLVLTSAVAGGWLVATARDSTDYWLVRAEVKAGEPVRADQLAPVSGRVESAGSGTLLPTEYGVPRGVWARDVGAGTLMTRDAVHRGVEPGRQLAMALTAGSAPPDLETGDRVDVWAGPGETGDGAASTRRVLSDVAVVSVSASDGTGSRTLVVDTDRRGPDAEVVEAVARGRLSVVRVP
ncbi:hypothetical protein GL325_05405 [Aeromicrobium sp. 636]|uniref:SAF domain-containing protein n=1 Tax=Aeromicrobium senzhongii TaxID=2663859 RepID=A0A8I0EUB1_9ACTN|nr:MULTISPECIES: hypothetical protein [Aeromicrobium]MBC9225753.1 hypothetical protein [Aeromicrobium senzhongii]MCQ3997862.1 hypothetical protein [Aeromicrobium sp. 636]MTB87790.1 hypothetical protein [Aeromicrobium senzhongii]QNL95186.1 hypothetical protein H9L21_04405 [Aeromicrobium senzhongii]